MSKKMDNDAQRTMVRNTYGQIAQASDGCCAPSGCGLEPIPVTSERLGYQKTHLNTLPKGADLGLGCGTPIDHAALAPGETVLDLGSGAGIDCFFAAQAVGERGRVIGVDMTADMVERARTNAAQGNHSNVEFRLGEIEHLPVANATINVVISNCVVNLSPDKEQVFREVFRVLKDGGRVVISDVVARGELPDNIRNDKALLVGCMGGAATITEIKEMLAEAGFEGILVTPKDGSADFIRDWAPGTAIEEFVVSAVIEATKPAS